MLNPALHVCYGTFVGLVPKNLVERSPFGHFVLNVLPRDLWNCLEPLVGQQIDQGFRTVPETARLYIEGEMSKGRTIREIRESGAAFQRRLVEMQLKVEGGLRPVDVIFLDRGVPDHFAYCRAFGPNPNEFLAECFHHRYASVFVLDPLPFQENGAGDEDATIAGHLGEWTVRDYSALGYSVVRVPVLSPEERLAFVLERLAEQGLA